MLKISTSLLVASAIFSSQLLAAQADQNIPPQTEKSSLMTVPYVQKTVGEIPIEEFKKAVGTDNFLFADTMLEIVAVFDVSKEMYLVKAFQNIDMRQYGQEGFSKRPVDLYVTKSGGTFIAGNVMDKKAQPIALKLSLAENKDKAAFTYGKGEKEIYVFTDPDCPYCEQFENQFKNLKDEYKIYVYLFPLEQLHPNARKKSQYILMQPKEQRYETYKRIQGVENTNKEWDTKISEKAEQELNEMFSYEAKYVGVKGTPYVVDREGTFVNRAILFNK